MNKNIEILEFLSELSKNNSKEWFDKNRIRYQELRESFIDQTAEMIKEISIFDGRVRFENPRKSIFRINRDIRFSKNKSPYKTNFGAFIVPEGKKSGNAGYYFHLEPDNCFVAGGIYRPQASELKKIRWAIFENTEEYIKIIENKEFKNTFGEIVGDKLKNPPRGFDKNFEHIDLLKYKDFTMIKHLKKKELASKNFISEMGRYFSKMFEYNQFLNKAIKE